MKAVQLKEFGGPEQLFIGDWETPTPKANEILVKVHASALNRADTLQRMGRYPAPKGDSPILGLEMAGEVADKCDDNSGRKFNDNCGEKSSLFSSSRKI